MKASTFVKKAVACALLVAVTVLLMTCFIMGDLDVFGWSWIARYNMVVTWALGTPAVAVLVWGD